MNDADNSRCLLVAMGYVVGGKCGMMGDYKRRTSNKRREKMATDTTTATDDAIRAAAIAKGYSDASVVTQKVQDRPQGTRCW